MRREIISRDQVFAIEPHEGWDDGRIGYVWCRFDAVLTEDYRHLRAEITWNNDDTDEPAWYFDPQLWIETNRRCKDGSLETVSGFRVSLTTEEALAMLAGDPKQLLGRYADRIAGLKSLPEQAGGRS